MRQVFKRTDTNKNFLKTIEANDTTKFVDLLVNKSKSLKDNVANEFKESIAFNKKTSKSLLINTVEKLGIKVNDISTCNFASTDMSNNLDALDFYLKEELNKEEYAFVFKSNFYASYVAFCYYLYREDVEEIDYEMVNELVIDRIKNTTQDEISSLKLDKEDCALDKIINFFRLGAE